MTDRLRLPFFIGAVVCLAVAVVLELGSLHFLNADRGQPPGLAIGYLALVDGTVLFTVALMALSLVVGRSLEGRIQGIASVVFSIVIIIAGIIMIFIAISLLLLMIGLLLSFPFGPAIYLGLFGSFPRGLAAVFLGLIMVLKLAFAVGLPLAQQRFLMMKGLIVLVLASLLANIVVAFLQGLPPGVLVSITDAIAAIVVAVLGVILAVVTLVFAVVAVVRAARVDRGAQAS